MFTLLFGGPEITFIMTDENSSPRRNVEAAVLSLAII